MPTRRTALDPTSLAGLASCGANAADAGAGGSDEGGLRFAWWGNTERDEFAKQAIQAYTEVAPEVSVPRARSVT
ncbi:MULTISPECIES: hypothetical protein [unclassified Brachybacterium]|uniref:hypothetical protein n=1 Tax=unclassified Brachybacterium TaxID=2623841 RepID=UPI00360D7C4B